MRIDQCRTGGKVQGRAATLLCAFEPDAKWDPSALEFTVNGTHCPVCADSSKFELPDPDWKVIVCNIPDRVLKAGSSVIGFRMLRLVDAVLHWCEIDLI